MKFHLFDLGEIMVTTAARVALAEAAEDATDYLARHMGGDWGEVNIRRHAANDRAVAGGGRIISGYRTWVNDRLLVITEGDRSATSVLLREEY